MRVLLLLLVLAGPTSAAEIHRCVAKGGAVSFQNDPCPTGARSTRTLAYAPEPDSDPRQRLRAIEAEMARRNAAAQRAPRGRTYAVTQPIDTDCELAKANREATLKRVGLRRTYDMLSALDAAVREACR